MSRSRSAGFTLIEVLLATMLLVGGLALAFATLRSASAVSQRGEAIAQRSERVRAVEEFLRRRLAAALPIAMGIDPQSQQPMLFIGEPQRLRFAADVPDYLGRGGPYLHDLSVAGDGEQRTLRIALTMLQSGKSIEEGTTLPPETLAENVQQVSFRYRGMDPQSGRLSAWLPQWEWHDRLPLLVRIEIRSGGAAWPPLVVALPQSSNPGAGQ
ncbi:type II secretion system protein J [Xanthomonas arboricola]|uniref:type II secretion system protein J n=1 Tax=Xanthomonas arboricola TaxID=56448 RepID=UPI00069FFBF6|nr:type II secretion system protein J [Xanthomonas arboricola]AKU50955.1 general secretion pathway protein GspJ [Xanthomonas arboricola pv. juglandis]KOB28981.1 general secretion pathway protein GspJ [Xanthomonas arboricola]KOB49258.1 general secretion pathway protein GspJ [Xanthomonas arboricola]MBB6258859.1 general secretion pathway protein J [Xanthomonas arboricola]MEA5147673.1 type II secretion system protein J [Xanthomonas arboricola]